MKIAVAGKGGVGKTTISGTLARALGRAGHEVLALDADSNPMLGLSLGLGIERTDALVTVRQAVDDGEAEHEPTVEGMVERFGADAPDGVRLVVASRLDNFLPGCQCCGITPHGLLQELEQRRRVVIGDLEAGLGTLMQLPAGSADVVLVVANPSWKALDVAGRAAELVSDRAEVIVVANRVRRESDLEMVREALGDRELVVVPEDESITAAERSAAAPMDLDPHSPGVAAVTELADRLAGSAVPA